jgi:hypothetical protein
MKMHIILVEFEDRSHVISNKQSIFSAVELELFDGFVERETIENAFAEKELLEGDRVTVLQKSILLDDVDKVHNHLRLRSMKLLSLT